MDDTPPPPYYDYPTAHPAYDHRKNWGCRLINRTFRIQELLVKDAQPLNPIPQPRYTSLGYNIWAKSIGRIRSYRQRKKKR